MAGGFLEHVKHDHPEVGEPAPPLPQRGSGCRGAMSSGVVVMMAFARLISFRYKLKTSSADSPGSTCHSALRPCGKKSNDSPPTTLRNQ